MYEAKCTIEGIVPIMFSRFPLPTKPGDTKKQQKKQTIAEKMWIDKKSTGKWSGGVYIPTDNLRMLLIGNRFRPGASKIYGSEYESKKGTKYLNFCKACVWVIGDNGKVYFKKKRTTWDDIDIRSFINASGSRSTCERPVLLTPWSLDFTVQVTDDSVSEDIIHCMYDVAGMRCGLGVYGPTFGRFIVKEWKASRGHQSELEVTGVDLNRKQLE